MGTFPFCMSAQLFSMASRKRVSSSFGSPGSWDWLWVQRVSSGPIHTRADLPGGSERLFAVADGIERVLVNGQDIVLRGAETGELPGRLLRSGRDTDTVSVGAR